MFISSSVSLSAGDESGTVLDVEDTIVSNHLKIPVFLGQTSSLEPFDNLLNRYSYYLDIFIVIITIDIISILQMRKLRNQRG